MLPARDDARKPARTQYQREPLQNCSTGRESALISWKMERTDVRCDGFLKMPHTIRFRKPAAALRSVCLRFRLISSEETWHDTRDLQKGFRAESPMMPW